MRPEATRSRDRDPRRVLAVHERLHQQDARLPAGVDHPLRLGRGHRERLLAQDVLAGPGRRDRPLGVEVVRQRDVDGVDVRVGQQRLVRAVRARDPELAGDPAGAARLAGRDAEHLAASASGAGRGSPSRVAMFAVDSTPQRTALIGLRPSSGP